MHLGQDFRGKSLCDPVKRKFRKDLGGISGEKDGLEDVGAPTGSLDARLDALGDCW